MNEKLAGSLRSKTQWFGVLLVVLGTLQDQAQLLSAFLGPDAMGKVMAGIGIIVMILRAVTSEALDEKAVPKEGGFIRLELLVALVVMSLAVSGCALLEDATAPLPRATSTEAAPVKAARVAIDEANAALIGLNAVIGDNARAGIWTKAQAQGALDDSKAAGLRLDRAREALRAGLPLDAQSQAEAVRALVLALHKRAAAEARKEK